MKATNIIWSVDKEYGTADLPTEIEIPNDMMNTDRIADYLSDVTGFCHEGFRLTGHQTITAHTAKEAIEKLFDMYDKSDMFIESFLSHIAIHGLSLADIRSVIATFYVKTSPVVQDLLED